MKPLFAAIQAADPMWAVPLLRLLPAAAVAIALDRLALWLVPRAGACRPARSVGKGKQGGRQNRAALALRRPWTTAMTGNFLGWLAVFLLMPLIWQGLHTIPQALTANPLKQWYLHVQLRTRHDIVWLAAATLIPALVMHAITWAAAARRRPPTLWLIPAFALTELTATLAAAALTRLLG